MTATPDTTIWTTRQKLILGAVLAVWFAAAAVIGGSHVLADPQGASLVPPIAVTLAVPVAVFLGLYRWSAGFRGFILAQDIETLTMLQHWRVIGFAFLPLYFFDVLPALFALVAGLGDVAVGLGAPRVVRRLRHDPGFAATGRFRRFHYLGLLDFAGAVSTAALTSGAIAALTPGGITSAPMNVWPMNLFPSFIAPAFVLLHLAVLLKLREARVPGTARRVAAAQAA